MLNAPPSASALISEGHDGNRFHQAPTEASAARVTRCSTASGISLGACAVSSRTSAARHPCDNRCVHISMSVICLAATAVFRINEA